MIQYQAVRVSLTKVPRGEEDLMEFRDVWMVAQRQLLVVKDLHFEGETM